MDLYGLIGQSLKHSFSKEYFQKKFKAKRIDADYQLFEMDELINLHDFFNSLPNLKGINVTIPYKRAVINQMDDLSSIARITGSVNVVKAIRKNKNILLKGFNTDSNAFEKSLKPLIKGRKNLRALILGTGGAAHAVAYILRKKGIYFYFVSRKPLKVETMSYTWITPKIMKDFQLIINTTPVGMFPYTNEKPEILYDELTPSHILYDLTYNPEETLFLKTGREKGAKIKNGYEMLEIQAEESWKIWQSKKQEKNENNHFWLW